MNIKNIQNINFKSQLLDKYIKAQNAANNPTQNQKETSLPIGVFNQLACQPNKTNVNAREFIIEKATLLNDIVFLANNNSSIKIELLEFLKNHSQK